jgi:hypothetical protein
MLKIASVFVIGLVGLLAVRLVPSDVKHNFELSVERNLEIHMDHFRGPGR